MISEVVTHSFFSGGPGITAIGTENAWVRKVHGSFLGDLSWQTAGKSTHGSAELWSLWLLSFAGSFLNLSCLGAADAVVSKWKARHLREHCISEEDKWNDFSPLSRVQVNGDFQGVVRGLSGGGACMQRAKCGK